MPHSNQHTFSKEDRERIGDSFLDLMLHEVFDLPSTITIDFKTNRIAFEELTSDASPMQKQLYYAAKDVAHDAGHLTVTALMNSVASQRHDHSCIQALQFFKVLHDREGLVGVADFLIRNLPKERAALENIALDTGEMRCLLEDKTRDAVVRHTRRSVLCSTAVVPAIALMVIAHESKQDIKSRLYSELNRRPRKDADPAMIGVSPANAGILRREFMAARTTAGVFGTGVTLLDGLTVFDLRPVPLPFPEKNPYPMYIHVQDRQYPFPSDAVGTDLEQRYSWVHKTVQPLGLLMALGAVGMATVHVAKLVNIKLQRKQAAKELVKPICEIFSKVMEAMDAQEAREPPQPARG